MPSPGEQALQLVWKTIGKAIDDGNHRLSSLNESRDETRHLSETHPVHGSNSLRKGATQTHSPPIEPRDDLTASRMHLSSYRKRHAKTVPDTLQTSVEAQNHGQPTASTSATDLRCTNHRSPAPCYKHSSHMSLNRAPTSPCISQSSPQPEIDRTPTQSPLVLPTQAPVDQLDTSVLRIAQAVYASVHQLQGHANSLSTLIHAQTPSSEPSSFEKSARNAEVCLDELECLLQNRSGSSGELRLACERTIKTYQAICSEILEHVDTIVEEADAQIVSDILKVLYRSIMVMRTHLSGLGNVNDSATPKLSPTASARSSSRGFQEVQRLVSPPYSPVISDSMGEYRSQTTPTASDHSAAFDGFSDNAYALSGVLSIALRRSCIVAVKVLPHFNDWFQQTRQRLSHQAVSSEIITIWQAASTSCARVISQAHAIQSCLPTVKLHSTTPVELYELVSNLVNAWTDFIRIIRSWPSIIRLSAMSRTELNHVQKTLKEVTGLVVALRATAEAAASPSGSSISQASPPLTPRQEPRGLVIRDGFPF